MKLSQFKNDWYTPGKGKFIQLLWYVTSSMIFNSYLLPAYGIKTKLLRLFGASIGSNVLIKPKVNIKYPWKLTIGSDVWIGEKVWIDNLGDVSIGNDVCISQGAFLLTGNHNYKKDGFDLMVGEIIIEDKVWIGAQTTVCPGVTCKTGSILAVGSVATTDLDADMIYQGNPSIVKRKRY